MTGRIGGNDWALLLIKYDSYALRMLECWLFILIFVLLLPVAFEEWRTNPYNQQISGTEDVDYAEASAGSV